MEEANNQAEPVDADVDADDVIESSDIEEEDCTFRDRSYIIMDKKVLKRLKQNDPSIKSIKIGLHCDDDGECFFNTINWKKDGDCIANNTQLKNLHLHYEGRDFYEEKYILGELGNNLPTRQQLHDFFTCIHRNSSITTLSFRSIQIVEEFGGSIIEGLCGHPSLTKFEISQIGLGRLGSIGCEALRKVLKHPTSKLTNLCIINSQLYDESFGALCDGLLGNSMMKRLSLHGNKDITSIGCRALSTVIRHPKCKLVELNLLDTGIDYAGADILGNAFSGSSSIRVLNLSSNKSISSAGWQSLFNHLSQSLVKSLDLYYNKIDDSGLASLANIGTLKSLDLCGNKLITPEGWQSFFNTLRTRGTSLMKLDVSDNLIGNVNVGALGGLLGGMDMLKELNMIEMDHSILVSITPRGWQTLFNSLQDSNLNLVKLYIGGNTIGDEGMQLLVRLLKNMGSLKDLRLFNNRFVTPTGWQALTGFFQSPNFALEVLRLSDNRINDDTIVAFTSALANNKTMNTLHLYQDPDEDASDDEDVDNELITERGWEAMSTLLCNKTSIMETYTSNHTLQDIGCYTIDDLISYLELNENKDKAEVARQKILQTHFSTDDHDLSKMQVFLDMEFETMPDALSWIGRPNHNDWTGKSVSGLSLLFNLMRRIPDLFDSNTQKKKPSTAKRKRDV